MKNSGSIENYIEDIRSPIWVYLILGFTLGTNFAIVTGVFFVSVINGPLLSGFQSYFFYVAFLFGALISFYSLVWLTHVKIRYEGDFIFVEKGRKKVKFNINSVDRVTKVDHTTRRKGSKTFMALFCKTALKVAYRNDDGSYNIIFSTNKPEYLIQSFWSQKSQ